MKKILILLSFTTIFSLISCSNDPEQYVAKAPASGVSSINPSSTTILLSKLDKTQTAIAFNWENTDYGVDTPATYTLEMDVLSGDYSKPEVVVTTSNQITITHANLNAMCLNKDLLVGVPNQVKVRVKTSLRYDALPTYSKEEILTITPFEDLVIPLPPSNELYLQGSAVPTNWGYPLPVSQKLTKDPNKAVFTITTTLTGGKELVFLSVSGFYGNPAYKALTSSQPLVGGLFTENKAPNWLGSNIIIPPATGVYKVTVNFVSGTFSIVKQ